MADGKNRPRAKGLLEKAQASLHRAGEKSAHGLRKTRERVSGALGTAAERIRESEAGERISAALETQRVIRRASEAQARGNSGLAYRLLEEEHRLRPDDDKLILAFWNLAASVDRAPDVAPAAQRVVRRHAGRGETEEAAKLWLDIVMAVPGARCDAGSLIRMIPVLELMDRERAVQALRQAVDPETSGLTPGLAFRAAELARELDPPTAAVAARVALESPDIAASKRARLEAMARQHESVGEPAPAPAPETVESAPEDEAEAVEPRQVWELPESQSEPEPEPEPEPESESDLELDLDADLEPELEEADELEAEPQDLVEKTDGEVAPVAVLEEEAPEIAPAVIEDEAPEIAPAAVVEDEQDITPAIPLDDEPEIARAAVVEDEPNTTPAIPLDDGPEIVSEPPLTEDPEPAPGTAPALEPAEDVSTAPDASPLDDSNPIPLRPRRRPRGRGAARSRRRRPTAAGVDAFEAAVTQPILETDDPPLPQSTPTSAEGDAKDDAETFSELVFGEEPETVERFTGIKVMEASPVGLTEEGLKLSLASGRRAFVGYEKIQALAVGELHGGEPNGVVVDLALNWRGPRDGALRVVRLRGEHFEMNDVDSEITGPQTLRGLLAQLMSRSDAVPLPDVDAALGDPLHVFDDLETYQREVLQVE